MQREWKPTSIRLKIYAIFVAMITFEINIHVNVEKNQENSVAPIKYDYHNYISDVSGPTGHNGLN